MGQMNSFFTCLVLRVASDLALIRQYHHLLIMIVDLLVSFGVSVDYELR